MDFNILQEIREIVHGLGEKKQRKDTMATIQSVLFKQMALLIIQAKNAAIQFSKDDISIYDVVYVLRNHKRTLKRMSRYYLFKENVHSFTSLNHVKNEKQECSDENKTKRRKLNDDLEPFYKDIAETSALCLYDKTNLDPISILTEKYDSQLKNGQIKKKKGVHNDIIQATAKLKLDLNIVNEEGVPSTTESRQIRINELAKLLSPAAYQGFHLCRTRVFHNKTGKLLLNKVHNALPLEINYNARVQDILLYLAKETIACLIDRVYENREKNKTVDLNPINVPNKDILNSKIVKREAITADEITAITTLAWNQSLDNIHIPFKRNDNFFSSPLIFE